MNTSTLRTMLLALSLSACASESLPLPDASTLDASLLDSSSSDAGTSDSEVDSGLDRRPCIGECEYCQDAVRRVVSCGNGAQLAGGPDQHLSDCVRRGYQPTLDPRHIPALRACVANSQCGMFSRAACERELAVRLAEESLGADVVDACIRNRNARTCMAIVAARDLQAAGLLGHCLERWAECAPLGDYYASAECLELALLTSEETRRGLACLDASNTCTQILSCGE